MYVVCCLKEPPPETISMRVWNHLQVRGWLLFDVNAVVQKHAEDRCWTSDVMRMVQFVQGALVWDHASVLFHCMGGNNRSPLAAALYLTWKLRINPEATFRYLQRQRHRIAWPPAASQALLWDWFLMCNLMPAQCFALPEGTAATNPAMSRTVDLNASTATAAAP